MNWLIGAIILSLVIYELYRGIIAFLNWYLDFGTMGDDQ